MPCSGLLPAAVQGSEPQHLRGAQPVTGSGSPSETSCRPSSLGRAWGGTGIGDMASGPAAAGCLQAGRHGQIGCRCRHCQAGRATHGAPTNPAPPASIGHVLCHRSRRTRHVRPRALATPATLPARNRQVPGIGPTGCVTSATDAAPPKHAVNRRFDRFGGGTSCVRCRISGAGPLSLPRSHRRVAARDAGRHLTSLSMLMLMSFVSAAMKTNLSLGCVAPVLPRWPPPEPRWRCAARAASRMALSLDACRANRSWRRATQSCWPARCSRASHRSAARDAHAGGGVIASGTA